VKAILVDRALKSGMAVAGSFQRRADLENRHQS
jgi:hypothetical protein